MMKISEEATSLWNEGRPGLDDFTKRVFRSPINRERLGEPDSLFRRYCDATVWLTDESDPLWRVFPERQHEVEYAIAAVGLASGQMPYIEGRRLVQPILKGRHTEVRHELLQQWYKLLGDHAMTVNGSVGLENRDSVLKLVQQDLRTITERWYESIGNNYRVGSDEWIREMGVYCAKAQMSKRERKLMIKLTTQLAISRLPGWRDLAYNFPRFEEGLKDRGIRAPIPNDKRPLGVLLPVIYAAMKHKKYQSLIQLRGVFDEVLKNTKVDELAPYAYGEMLYIARLVHVDSGLITRVQEKIEKLLNSDGLDETKELEVSRGWASMLSYYLIGGGDWDGAAEWRDSLSREKAMHALEKIKDPVQLIKGISRSMFGGWISFKDISELEGLIESSVEMVVALDKKVDEDSVRRNLEGRLLEMVCDPFSGMVDGRVLEADYLSGLILKGAADKWLLRIARAVTLRKGWYPKLNELLLARAEALLDESGTGNAKELQKLRIGQGVMVILKTDGNRR